MYCSGSGSNSVAKLVNGQSSLRHNVPKRAGPQIPSAVNRDRDRTHRIIRPNQHVTAASNPIDDKPRASQRLNNSPAIDRRLTVRAGCAADYFRTGRLPASTVTLLNCGSIDDHLPVSPGGEAPIGEVTSVVAAGLPVFAYQASATAPKSAS